MGRSIYFICWPSSEKKSKRGEDRVFILRSGISPLSFVALTRRGKRTKEKGQSFRFATPIHVLPPEAR